MPSLACLSGSTVSSALRLAIPGVAVLAMALIVHHGLYFFFRGTLPTDPQLVAHRGGLVDAPENTLAAFENAVAIGADGIEMDVQRTRDEVLVVLHDETVNRTTNGTGLVANLTFDETRALDARSENCLVLRGDSTGWA